jgi:hypothetical protein
MWNANPPNSVKFSQVIEITGRFAGGRAAAGALSMHPQDAPSRRLAGRLAA